MPGCLWTRSMSEVDASDAALPFWCAPVEARCLVPSEAEGILGCQQYVGCIFAFASLPTSTSRRRVRLAVEATSRFAILDWIPIGMVLL
eukprot:g25655.t1